MKNIADLHREAGGRCSYCDRLTYLTAGEGGLDALAVREHRIPRSRGGGNQASNIALSCYRCDQIKGRSTDDEFLDRLARDRRREMDAIWRTNLKRQDEGGAD
ncbi:HNH endonuclease [Zavarzinia sp.]|uniref:HNH endonuclease n=1 Tax=Zavarzinia sp. TaxID=2027920 RepID=UPI003BB77B37